MTVSLIVMNYNGIIHLKEYFRSLFKQTRLPDEIFMYDNGSIDGSCDFVRKHFPEVKIIHKDDFNTGVPLGCNIAFKKTKGDLVIFQSNDIRLDKNCINNLIEVLDSEPKVGLCSSVNMMYTRNKKTKAYHVQNTGASIDIFGFNWPENLGKKLQRIPSKKEVFLVYGNSIIIRRRLFEKLNGFDEKYFMLNDDVDLSWRVRLLGYKVMYSSRSIIYHKGHATLGTLYKRAIKRYWSERNCMRTLLKNYSIPSLLIFFPPYLILVLCEMFYHVVKRQPALSFSLVKAIGWNIVYLPDTLKKRFEIQKIRMVGDREIIKYMYKGSFKFRFGL